MVNKNIIIESCVENVAEAIFAEQEGAHQLEVCGDLEHDGLTPNDDILLDIINTVRIPCKVMIRSRTGDFYYTQAELARMLADIQRIKAYRIDGFVFGALVRSKEGRNCLDIASIYQICKAAYPYPVTVHKAIDLCDDILSEVNKLKNISNVRFILTSGGAPTASDGIKMLKKMGSEAGQNIDIIAAGKVTKTNLDKIAQSTELKYFHGRKIV